MKKQVVLAEIQQFHILHKMMPAAKLAGVIFCFVLFLPYVVIVFSGRIEEAVRFPVLEGPEITIVTEKGTERIPTDEYLCGVLAQYYEEGYTKEELKALSIILRTNLIYHLGAQKDFCREIWDIRERKTRWGVNFSTYETEVKNVIAETSGKILLINGKAEEISIPSFPHNERAWDKILEEDFADYIIYQYF